MSLTIRVW